VIAMTMTRALFVLALVACSSQKQEPAKQLPQTVRVAVIGGMVETGFWYEIATRFERSTGHKIELASSGPKPVVIDDFRKGNIDLITLHASDAIVNLVVDGLAADPQPWVQNDLVFVGPSADPAGIRGEKDAVAALKKLVAANAKVVIHASLGADGVLHDLEHEAKVTLPEANLIVFGGQKQHEILARAAQENAYTLVGRIPMLTGKLAHPGIEILVRGDGRLRRPYLVAVAQRAADQPRIAAARELVTFLRLPATQDFIASFAKGRYDDQSLFFPIVMRP
jgi:tungstate transport system substrate-binding protein